MKKKTWIVLTVCGSLIVGGFAWANSNANQVEASSPTLREQVSDAFERYEEQKKIAGLPGATTEDEQQLKELAAEAWALKDKLNPKSPLDEFNEVFAGYKDLYKIESAYYADQQDSEDPAVQRVLYELEQKGKLIAQFESQALSKSVKSESLLDTFMEETSKLNQELYPEQFE